MASKEEFKIYLLERQTGENANWNYKCTIITTAVMLELVHKWNKLGSTGVSAVSKHPGLQIPQIPWCLLSFAEPSSPLSHVAAVTV